MHFGHVALQVRDLESSMSHATGTLGLLESLRDGPSAFLTANDKHHELQLVGTGTAGLDHIGLEVERREELDELRDRVIADGARILSEGPEEPGLDEAFRCEGPGGVVFEIYTGMERQPLSLDTILRPFARKLGHVNLLSDEKPELERFILDVLGFRISDRLGDVATWMRCDTDHHGIALTKVSGVTRLHHYAWELENWSAMGRYADHVARSGQKFIWGPGRHGPGLNQFTYLVDPDGAVVEAYCDLLRISDEAAYEPIDWSKEPRALNLWGPVLPADWGEHGVPALKPADVGQPT
jgi:catechol-2,3-dioxygenase